MLMQEETKSMLIRPRKLLMQLADGVKAIQLQDKEHEGRRSSCFHLIRPDGSSEDVSYRYQLRWLLSILWRNGVVSSAAKHALSPDDNTLPAFPCTYRKCISSLDKSMANLFAKEDEKQATKDKAPKPSRNTRSGGRGRGRGPR